MPRNVLLVVGAQFSGVTLLGRRLGLHREVFAAGEVSRLFPAAVHRTPRACRCSGDTACPVWEHDPVRSAVASGPRGLYAALANASQRPVVVDISRSAAWVIARLADWDEVDGEPRIVLCTTDPLLFVRKRRTLARESAHLSATHWLNQHETALQAAVALGRPALTLRYDEIAYATEAALRRVCAFAGLEFDERMRDEAAIPSHLEGGNDDGAFGVTDPVNASPSGFSELRSELDADAGVALGVVQVRQVQRALEGSVVPALLGYAVELPPYQIARDDAEREATIAWVNQDLAAARDAMIARQPHVACERLALLADHFEVHFEDLGLKLDYSQLTQILIQALHEAGRDVEAIRYARKLTAVEPAVAEHRHRLAQLLAASGDVSGSLTMRSQWLELAMEEAPVEAVAAEVTRWLPGIHPDEPCLEPFLAELVRHVGLAEAVDVALDQVVATTRSAEGYACLGLVRAARGKVEDATRLLEEGLTYHSRDTNLQAAWSRILARRHPEPGRKREGATAQAA